MVQVKKKQRYNELKYRGKNSLIMLNKDTEIFDTKNINLCLSLLGSFCPGGGGFCPSGAFVQGAFVRGLMSGGGGFSPGGFCPRPH